MFFFFFLGSTRTTLRGENVVELKRKTIEIFSTQKKKKRYGETF